MGEYNPHLPYILGQEWVGIRNENVTFEPTFNTVESGHRFNLATASQVNHGRVYVDTINPSGDQGQQVAISLYAAGTAAQSGPIRRAIIPVSTATITGTAGGTTISVSGATTALEAVTVEGKTSLVLFSFGTSEFRSLTVQFDIARYAGLIKDKRILELNLIYTAFATESLIDTDPVQNFGYANSVTNTSILHTTSPDPFGSRMILGRVLSRPDGYALPLGELNYWFGGQAPGTAPNYDRMNWNYAELLRLAGTGALATIRTVFEAGGFSTVADLLSIYYVALEVIYCDERRLAYGATQFGTNFGSTGRSPNLGAIPVNLRDPLTYATNPVMAAGQYDLVASSAAIPVITPVVGFANLNALRELYDIPAHPGINVVIPSPLDDVAIGKSITTQTTSILPQLSLHTTGGTLTQPHAYGRQAMAQVYGANTAIQDIYDVPVGGVRSYPQVRYYARRFGGTTQPLVLDSPTITGSSASLSVAVFDALPEIVDGWKEITLRFASAPSMGTGTIPRWRWSSTLETNAGNRWEILGVSAPYITGVPSNQLNLVASPNQTSVATYGAAVSGGVIDLDWMPGIAPLVTGTTDDPSTDAVLIFSQDPPTITGLTITLSSQAVTGFTECSHAPCCVPSAIGYHRITWTAQSTLPTTGFGAYELQRLDAVDGTWQTIMLATNPTITGFNDYEARVGVLSSYQIRCTNALDFAGSWSTTGTGTITAPGVTLPSCGTNKRGMLIFTSNESQTGVYNLAYAMTWDAQSEVVEDFSFGEAGSVDFERYHDRDYQVAIRGSERGGEQFSRRLLLSNAAVALPRLGNTRSLRDMAWADLPYVCVRDDIGDRWFASVIVPQAEVRRNRRLYNADITVIETTATPSPVNP